MSERAQRSFDVDFKKVAVARLALGESATALAAELRINRTLVYRWREAQRAGRLDGEVAGARPERPDLPAATRATAKVLAAEAMAALADVMKNGNSEAARIAAANAILDRAHGKAGQTAEAKAKAEVKVVTRIERIIVDHRN